MARFLTQLLVLGGITAITTLACSSGSDCDFGLCVGTPVGSVIGPDGGPIVVVPDVDPPPGCNALADSTSPEGLPCAANAYALFVDAAASPGGDGSKEKPYAKMTDAIAQVASSGKRRIYACGSSTFPERLQLGTASYASLYGGFACGTWKPDSASRPIIAPSTAGYALQVTNLPSEKTITVADLEIKSVDLGETKEGASSIAVFTNASSIAFVRTTIRAGAGGAGKGGDAGEIGRLTKLLRNGIEMPLATATTAGDSATSTAAGGLKECTCATDTRNSEGAAGGGNKNPGGQGLPKRDGATGQGTPGAGGDACGNGGAGSDAPDADPAPKSTTRGSLAADTGWRATSGASGEKSGEFGGGGGGGGSQASTGYGGGGGCGGCGGRPGTGGGGGGASIAVLAIGGALSFSSSTLYAANGGVGGAGGKGGLGQIGGGPGGRFGTGLACDGGKGGRGGDGAGGAGGAGGLSVGLLHSAATLNGIDSGSVHIQSPGPGGEGGKKGTNDGLPGRAEPILDVANVND